MPVLVAASGWLPAPAAGSERAVPLTSGWEFRTDPGDEGLAAGWGAGGPAEGWQAVSVPHVMDTRPLAAGFRGAVGWYRLVLPEVPPGAGAWAVRFRQARHQARVWLDGREIGGNTDPYAPFELALPAGTPRPGSTLVVRVDNRRPRGLREGWWNWGGLVRGVDLRPAGEVRMREQALLPRLRCGGDDGCRAAVLVDAVLRNTSRVRRRAFIAVSLTAPSGQVTQGVVRAGVLAPGAERRIRRELPVEGRPELWSPEHPDLYEARMELQVGGVTVQSEQSRVGLRSVRVRRGMLELNGRRLQLRGASIQEDVAGRGAGLTDEDVERTVTELQALGADVTRAHYALDERLLRRFDEEGILVWSQAPVYHADRELRTAAGRRRHLRRVRSEVLATRGHPSVIAHSVANELASRADRVPGTRAFLERAAGLARRLDPTRPVALDILSYPRIERQEVYRRFDLLGINSYYGWYPGKPGQSTQRLSSLPGYLAAMRRRYPRHAMLITEFGAEAFQEGDASLRGSYAFQSEYLARVLDVVDATPWLGGAVYWTLQEFAVKPGWDGGVGSVTTPDGIHKKGLVSYDGVRKPAWEEARRRFSAVPTHRAAE